MAAVVGDASGVAMLKYYRENPVEFVRWAFRVEPDEWQKDALLMLPGMSHPKISLQACVGPGKSALLAWAAWYFLALYSKPGYHPKGAALAITEKNLKDNLWAEMSVWQGKSDFLQKNFTVNADKIYHNDHQQTWFLSARSFARDASSEKIGAALAGLHAKFVLILLDETGAMNPAVLRVAEQALSNCEWGHIIQAGNPVSKEGCLYQAAASGAWDVIRITSDPDDPKRSPRVSKEWAADQIKTYGRENAWVKANILGEFPDTAFNSLIGPDEVRSAMGRNLPEDQWNWAQKRIGIDVARFGDDRTVLFPRQGRMCFLPVIMRKADTSEIAARYALAKSRWGSEWDSIDDTGGWAGGVIDQSRHAGNYIDAVNSSSSPSDPRYFNRRAEMWFTMCDWIKKGGALPLIPELVNELTAPMYYFQNGKLRVEEKEQIKKRLGRSPDLADALALTFSQAEMPSAARMPATVNKVISGVVDDQNPIGFEGEKRVAVIAERVYHSGDGTEVI